MMCVKNNPDPLHCKDCALSSGGSEQGTPVKLLFFFFHFLQYSFSSCVEVALTVI